MELYFAPMACSLASHITLREAGLEVALTAVTLSTKRTAAGDDYLAVTAKGQVPALRLDDGSVLTENAAVLQYLAEQRPDTGLLPAIGTPERYRVLEWLSFLGTEVHKACLAPQFNPEAPPEAKAWARTLLDRKLAYVATQAEGRTFLVGERFTIADAYLTWALNLCTLIRATLPPPLDQYLERMRSRPAVRAALAAETAAGAG